MLMQKAFGLPPLPEVDSVPLMYQGASDDLLGPCDDIPLPDEAHGIDFEGEFGVIVAEVPMGCPVSLAASRILLLVQINDVSLRAIAPFEMKRGFGFFQAKPSPPLSLRLRSRPTRSVTPGAIRGSASTWTSSATAGGSATRTGQKMRFGFDQLIAHAAATRRLSAGTVIGSGTVSNAGGKKGSACIAERRAIEMLEQGDARTPFMKFGERIRMDARLDGQPVFGPIDQRVVRADAQI